MTVLPQHFHKSIPPRVTPALRRCLLTATIAGVLAMGGPAHAQTQPRGGTGGGIDGAAGGSITSPNGQDGTGDGGGGGGGPGNGTGGAAAGAGGAGGDGGVHGLQGQQLTAGDHKGTAGEDGHPSDDPGDSGGGGGGGAGGYGAWITDADNGVVAQGQDFSGGTGGAGGLGGSNAAGTAAGGGDGGTGLHFAGGALDVAGTATGGHGGAGAFVGFIGNSIGGAGGRGGNGMAYFGDANSVLTIAATGDIAGGNGGEGGVGGYNRANGNGGAGGTGVFFASGGKLDNAGVITGGDGGDGDGATGTGGDGMVFQGRTLANTGTITGGAGGLGSNPLGELGMDGGAGLLFSGTNLDNFGTITGGDGADATDFGGYGGAGIELDSVNTYITNTGTITGGDGGGDNDTMSPGAGGVGIDALRRDVHIINGGTIAGGLGADGSRADAIRFAGGRNRLELHASSTIIGNVDATNDSYSTLVLGGTADGVFNLGQVGDAAQYRGFGSFEKLGAGTWTLEGSGAFSEAYVDGGTLVISAGATLESGDGIVGSIGGADGTAVVTGTGSEWMARDYLGVGRNGTGVLTIADGGKVTAPAAGIFVADSDRSSGTVNIGAAAGDKAAAPGILDADLLQFRGGDRGRLVFNHTDTGYVFDTRLDSMLGPGRPGTFVLRQLAGTTLLTGNSSGFAGTTRIEGGALLVNNTEGSGTGSGAVNVKSGGTLGGTGRIAGAVDVADGGILQGKQGQTLTMGSLVLHEGSNVNVTLDAPGNTTGLFAIEGDLTLDGSLNVTDAGDFDAGVYRLMDYADPDGLTDNGLRVGSAPAVGILDVQVQPGQVNLVVDVADLQFWDGDAAGHAGNGTVDGGDGTWTATGPTWTDLNGASNGAMNPTPGFAIFQGEPGTVTVDGSDGAIEVTGMQFAVDSYQLEGDTIHVNKAGTVLTDTVLQVGDGTAASAGYTVTIAADIDAADNVNKTGPGTLVLTGDNDLGFGLHVKDGALAIRDGGTVSSSRGRISNDAGAEATVIVTGKNSDWFTSEGLIVGGAGVLVIRDGGMVFSTDTGVDGDYVSGIVDGAAGSPGTATVTGDDSLWNNANDLFIGNTGAGRLIITDGGTVHSHGGAVGNGADSVGSTVVSGAGSTWARAENLSVGFDGKGTITIADGGVVSVDDGINVAVNADSSGTVNIGAAAGDEAVAAGTLEAGLLQFGSGDGRLVFNHTDDGYVFDTQLASRPTNPNAGAVEQLAGTTILTANNKDFLGTTTVKGGTLRVNNKNGTGTGTGAVNVKPGGTLGGTGRIAGAVDIGGGILQGKQGQTLTMGSLVLHKASQVNVTLDKPGNSKGLFAIEGDLTLDGTLNIANGGDFGPGVYRLMDYSGKLTDHILEIGAAPAALTGDLAVQTSVAKQVNLAVGEPADLQFWDGAAGNGGNNTIDGGSGIWTATSPNWTDVDGERNGAMDPSPGFAIFQGKSGTITTDASDGALAVTGLQFASDGYVVEGDAIELTEANSILRVGDGTQAGAGITATVDADLTGAGVRKTDRGTLVLTGANTWSGRTSVEGGTLHLAKGGSADTGAVEVGFSPTETGTLAITGTDTTWTADSAKIGFGGDGTLQLSDGGTFHVGGLTVAEFDSGTGRVIIGAAAGQTAAAAGHLDAETLTFGAGDGTLVFNHTDTDYTFATALAGNGSVQHLAGTTHLSADSSAFTGHTTVAGGTLAVDGTLGGTLDVARGGRLVGDGTVGDTTLEAGATVAPGYSIGTLTVDGDLTVDAGSTYAVEVGPAGTDSDLIHATGKAALQGGSVLHVGADGNYAPDAIYTIVTADDGVKGRFDTVASDFVFLDPTLGYGPNNVTLTLKRNNIDFGDIGRTRNQIATAAAIEALGFDNLVYGSVVTLDKPTARAAFDDLSGESYASTRAALLQESRFVREAMNRRLHRADTMRDDSATIGGTAGAFWTHVWGHWGSADGDGNAADMKANGSGLLVGIDAPLGDHLRGGVTAGTGETSVDVAARHSDANSRNDHVGAYLGGTWAGWTLDGGVAGSWHDIDSQRRPQVGLPGRVYANYDARTLQAFVEGGYRFEFAHGSVEPYLNATHVAVRTGEVNEHGSAAALHSNRETTEVNYGTLGVHGLWHLSGEGATRVSAYGTLGWQHAFGDRVALAHNHFAGGDRFTVAGTPWARDAAVVQAGIDFAIGRHTSFRAGYSGLIAKDASDHAAKMSLQVTF